MATIALLLLQPVDALYSAVIDRASEVIGEASPEMVITPAQKAEVLSMLKVFGPVSQSFGNMIMLFAGFYFAMVILAAMKRNVRPREDIRVALRMSRASLAVFVGVLLVFSVTAPFFLTIGNIGNVLGQSAIAGVLAIGLTIVVIALVPVVAGWLGWRWAFAFLALGPFVGAASMLRLRALPASRRLAGGLR